MSNDHRETPMDIRARRLFERMPEWARSAYVNDLSVHRVIRDCLMRGGGIEETIWDICSVLLVERNRFRNMLAESINARPIVFTAQSENVNGVK